jgi:hypothetical protein
VAAAAEESQEEEEDGWETASDVEEGDVVAPLPTRGRPAAAEGQEEGEEEEEQEEWVEWDIKRSLFDNHISK